jgi:hypothetical protein
MGSDGWHWGTQITSSGGQPKAIRFFGSRAATHALKYASRASCSGALTTRLSASGAAGSGQPVYREAAAN